MTPEREAEIRYLASVIDGYDHPNDTERAVCDLLAALDTHVWRDIAEFVPPSKHGEDSRAVLVWDGHHQAVSYCTFYTGGAITWWIDNSYGFNEDGEIYGVTHYRELLAPPATVKETTP